MACFECLPGGSVSGTIRVPGDKSISHRAIILSSLADGDSTIRGFLNGEDSLKTMQAFRAMGVAIEQNTDQIIVHGVGLNGLKMPTEELDMGNSGTAMRLLSGVLAGQKFNSCLIGDHSLSGRPMNRVIEPLRRMGAIIESSESGTAPLVIHGNHQLNAITYQLPMASAQVKSCLLLAGLYADGETVIREPALTRDHSEHMLRGFGCEVTTQSNEIRLQGGQRLTATHIDIPGDISSAAFFLVAASIAEQGQLTLERVGINPTRTGVIDILRLMGANIVLSNQTEVGGEPVADLTVRSARLQGITVPVDLVPLAIDEFPVLFIAAACAEGETLLSGATELRVKESDRIQVMADGLNKLGIEVVVTADGMCIRGGKITGGTLESYGDHRIAMAFSVAALMASDPIKISNCDNVNTSFPGFAELASSIGMWVKKHDRD